jgi:hypothetical protein
MFARLCVGGLSDADAEIGKAEKPPVSQTSCRTKSRRVKHCQQSTTMCVKEARHKGGGGAPPRRRVPAAVSCAWVAAVGGAQLKSRSSEKPSLRTAHKPREMSRGSSFNHAISSARTKKRCCSRWVRGRAQVQTRPRQRRQLLPRVGQMRDVVMHTAGLTNVAGAATDSISVISILVCRCRWSAAHPQNEPEWTTSRVRYPR